MSVASPRHFLRMSVGDATRRFRVTARALHHYESCGLVQAGRDRLNFRYYDAAAVERIELIAALRRAGVPLPDVTQVLRADEPLQRTIHALAALDAREQALRDQLERLQDVRETLRASSAVQTPGAAI